MHDVQISIHAVPISVHALVISIHDMRSLFINIYHRHRHQLTPAPLKFLADGGQSRREAIGRRLAQIVPEPLFIVT